MTYLDYLHQNIYISYYRKRIFFDIFEIEDLKQKFSTLDPNNPEHVERANKIKRDIATDKFLNEDKKIVVEMIREEMLEAAENLEFEKAANLRDEMNKLEKEIKL